MLDTGRQDPDMAELSSRKLDLSHHYIPQSDYEV